MPASAHNRLRVLVISPHPEVQGGVSAFAETMKAHFTGCDASSFYVGSRSNGKENVFLLIKRMLLAPFTIARLVRREHVDIIHINPSFDIKSLLRDGLILLILRWQRFRRVLVYFHGWQAALAGRIARTLFLRAFVAWALNGAARIMVLSPEFKTALEAIGVDGSRITVTHTMFDSSALYPSLPLLGGGQVGVSHADMNCDQQGGVLYDDPAKRGGLGAIPCPHSQKTILYLSRFVREKGVYELLDAFARIAGEFPDVDLVMAGAGKEEEALQARALMHGLSGRVKFPGYVRGAEKMALLMHCSIFALPTYFSEGLPVALLEAMGAGKPLLTASAGGIGSVISQPQNGIVLSTVTVDTVEQALRYLLSNPGYCADTGKRNAAYAHERFEAGVVTAEIESVYREMIAHE